MTTMTLDEIMNVEISEKRENEIRNFKMVDYTDCPKMTEKELSEFNPWYDTRKNIETTTIRLKIDTDILNAFKSEGKGYQERINKALRKVVFG